MLTLRRLVGAASALTFLLIASTTPSPSQEVVTTIGNTVTIRLSPGGSVDMFEARYAQMARAGYRFVIDGGCYSACTMAIGLPHGQVCATPRGVFGFHSAYTIDALGRHQYNAPATAQMARHWNSEVRTWLKMHGGLTPDIKAAPAVLFVPPCPVGDAGFVLGIMGIPTGSPMNTIGLTLHSANNPSTPSVTQSSPEVQPSELQTVDAVPVVHRDDSLPAAEIFLLLILATVAIIGGAFAAYVWHVSDGWANLINKE